MPNGQHVRWPGTQLHIASERSERQTCHILADIRSPMYGSMLRMASTAIDGDDGKKQYASKRDRILYISVQCTSSKRSTSSHSLFFFSFFFASVFLRRSINFIFDANLLKGAMLGLRLPASLDLGGSSCSMLVTFRVSSSL